MKLAIFNILGLIIDIRINKDALVSSFALRRWKNLCSSWGSTLYLCSYSPPASFSSSWFSRLLYPIPTTTVMDPFMLIRISYFTFASIFWLLILVLVFLMTVLGIERLAPVAQVEDAYKKFEFRWYWYGFRSFLLSFLSPCYCY